MIRVFFLTVIKRKRFRSFIKGCIKVSKLCTVVTDGVLEMGRLSVSGWMFGLTTDYFVLVLSVSFRKRICIKRCDFVTVEGVWDWDKFSFFIFFSVIMKIVTKRCVILLLWKIVFAVTVFWIWKWRRNVYGV